KVAGVRWVEADVRAVPPALARRFDLVVSTGAFGHVTRPEQPAFLEAVASLLRPGGTFGFVTGPRPPLLSLPGAAMRGFNAILAIRNRLWKPEFIMDYLNFCWPEIAPMLDAAGFEVDVVPLAIERRTSLVVVRASLRPARDTR
ncbi:MAG: methyltransferase domain-containing protein, partial [Deltaproteobacteria bacterium]|nr:methyltransferase domain-containing protein [Deltaproteobacteria bacterium]